MNRTFYPNPDTYEAPPSVAERADDERFFNEFNTIVATLRIALETTDRWRLTARLAEVCRGDYPLSAEQSVIYFCDHYGYPAVLRALATAIEQPINPSAPLVGD